MSSGLNNYGRFGKITTLASFKNLGKAENKSARALNSRLCISVMALLR